MGAIFISNASCRITIPCVNFNHFDDEDSHFLPDETMNKLFTGADGETLYTDDGYQYKLSTMPWCQDGTCKRQKMCI